AGPVEQIERIEAIGLLRDCAERIEQADLLAHLLPPPCGYVPSFALGIDDDHRAFETQQIRDDHAPALARAGGRDGYEGAVFAIEQRRFAWRRVLNGRPG